MAPYIYLLTSPIHRRGTHNIHVPCPVDRALAAEILVLVVASIVENLHHEVTSSTPRKLIIRFPCKHSIGVLGSPCKRKAPLRGLFGAMRQWSDDENISDKNLGWHGPTLAKCGKRDVSRGRKARQVKVGRLQPLETHWTATDASRLLYL